jgi:hypothetical protein
LAAIASDAVAGDDNPPQLLDVDVEQLARTLALVAQCRLKPQAAELAEPDPRQDPRHRRLRHPEQLGDLSAGEAQPPQRGDRLDAQLGRAVVDAAGRRRTIQQSELAFAAIAGHPLVGRARADFGGLGRLRQRPALLNYTPAEQLPLLQAERSVTVKPHPVSSLD